MATIDADIVARNALGEEISLLEALKHVSVNQLTRRVIGPLTTGAIVAGGAELEPFLILQRAPAARFFGEDWTAILSQEHHPQENLTPRDRAELCILRHLIRERGETVRLTRKAFEETRESASRCPRSPDSSPTEWREAEHHDLRTIIQLGIRRSLVKRGLYQSERVVTEITDRDHLLGEQLASTHEIISRQMPAFRVRLAQLLHADDLLSEGERVYPRGWKECLELRSSPSSRKSSAAPRERVGRNDPCPCGSGLKFKKCCGR